MSFRQDKLILLLDTGTSSAVRRTASKQLAELTHKIFKAARPDESQEKKVVIEDGDVKPDAVALHATVSEDEAWDEALETISKLVPILRSKQSESRSAAAHALGLLANYLPPHSSASLPSPAPVPFDTSPVDMLDLVQNGGTLLASAGREYIAKPGPADKAKRRQAMLESVGLGDAVGWGDDVDKVIGEEDDDVAMDGKKAGNGGQPTPPSSDPPVDIFEGLSARQVIMIKRKKGNMAEEANKMRKLNAQASNTAASVPTPSATPTPRGSPTKPAVALPAASSNAVVIDPGAKARAAASAGGGGQVEPSLDADGNPISSQAEKYRIKLQPGESPWVTIITEIIPYLSDSAWQARHGAAQGIMEIIRSLPPLGDAILLPIARHLLTLLALDRFGDFLGDTVVAPVRETSAQGLGICLKYLSPSGAREVHACLIQMIRQTWAKRGKEANGRAKWERFSWEIRHAGLLALKYEVAVRGDLLGEAVKSEDVKMEEGSGAGLMADVVDVTILSMKDADDDVRTVAASTLLAIAGQLATSLPDDQLRSIFDTVWHCLANDQDELGSSIGAIMDLLGIMLAYPRFIHLFDQAKNERLIPNIYPFRRHPIVSVRLAVAAALHRLATAEKFERGYWMHSDFLSYLFENLILEQNADIRRVSMEAWKPAMLEMAPSRNVKGIDEYYGLVMTPIGQPLDADLFEVDPKRRSGGHNVDKAMMAGDLGLVDAEVMWETRIDGARALGFMRGMGLADDLDLLRFALSSGSAHKILMASIIIQEWAREIDRTNTGPIFSLGETNSDAQTLVPILIRIIEAPPRDTYTEMTTILQRIQADCQALLAAFATEGKLAKKLIPTLPRKVNAASSSADVFTLATAQAAATTQFDGLIAQLGKVGKTAIPGLKDRQRKVIVSIGYYAVMKERYDTQVAAGVAGALVALRVLPAKFGVLIKAIMDSIKKEESTILQARSAASISAFIAYCSSPLFTRPVNPSNKVVSNLFTFLCSDTSLTPIFRPDSADIGGIETLREEKEAAAKAAKKKGKGQVAEEEETEAQIGMRVTRRGALEAFRALAGGFGERLFEGVPKFWEGIGSALLANFSAGTAVDVADDKLRSNAQAGQEVIDALTSLRLVAPDIDPRLHPQLSTLLPSIILALQSSFSIIRNTAARCFAALCDVMIDEAMKATVDAVVPLIGDARRVQARQGAVEAVHHIIKLLDIKALPYVLFLIVPILGRMSDPDEHVRLLSTGTFAALIKMVPLEAGIPDPPNFSPDLLAKRDEERMFLMQLLDGSKAEQYQIPIEIKADLRQYQKDGVSWLAFLAKYQLHGILCDDMGLGKSLQSICIIGSKHHERLTKHRLTGSPDSSHLPSLIVCPPTLTGHWYYEILKFTSSLRPLQYVGSHAQRAQLRTILTSHDVIITSYETVRSDIAELGKIEWLYCVLDEGHTIKNAKTKLAAAVKQIRAQHRLLLSGTPIQNNLLELWSLFDFLMPGFLGSERGFQEKFGKPVMADREGKATPKEREAATAALETLHKQVLPFLLRRLKEDVLSDLPPKIIQDYYCDLSPIQSVLYDEFAKSRAAEEAGEEVESEAKAGQGHVFQSLQYLRKLCNHPALVLDGADGQGRWDSLRSRAGLGKEVGLRDLGNAPKLEALKQLLNDCGIGLPASEKIDDTPSHRVLIFCQLRPMLDLIETSLFAPHMPSVTYMRMDGSTDPRKRHAVVQTFNENPAINVLLLTTSVGGLGLNLTGADTVIFVDHDWNPMKDLQAMDRAHRLGQRKVVSVYRLIMRGTLEEKIMGLQRFKLNIASSVVTQQNAGLGSMNTGEVLDLFKVSADGEPGKAKAGAVKSGGPMSAAKILEGLDDLPPEDEYADLSLSNFLSKV